MGDTLLFSNEKQGYTLTDRGTYLSMQDKLPDLTILVGGQTWPRTRTRRCSTPTACWPSTRRSIPAST